MTPALRNGIDVENTLRYPTARPRFMEQDERMNAFAEATLDDPAARRFVGSIPLRCRKPFDRAGEALLPDAMAGARADGRVVEAILQGATSRDPERIGAFVGEVLDEMLRQTIRAEDCQ